MGASFEFYNISMEKEKEFKDLIEVQCEDYDLQEWLENNTVIKDIKCDVSYGGSMNDFSTWCRDNAEYTYSAPCESDTFFRMKRTKESRKIFEVIAKDWSQLDVEALWSEDIFLVVYMMY